MLFCHVPSALSTVSFKKIMLLFCFFSPKYFWIFLFSYKGFFIYLIISSAKNYIFVKNCSLILVPGFSVHRVILSYFTFKKAPSTSAWCSLLMWCHSRWGKFNSGKITHFSFVNFIIVTLLWWRSNVVNHKMSTVLSQFYEENYQIS